ncbi:MAG: TlpA disulfide reductase family protein [Planctomycetota bacterium]|nr:TlpA disulfide reductase family protein [Planctomycetota bacterium]
MYPHERSLVEKMSGKPFALIGVNSDSDRDKVKKVIEEKGITWRSFWNGGSTSGPISTDWNIRGWPTAYLIDAKGVIRWKSVGVDENVLDAEIEKLMKEVEGGSG